MLKITSMQSLELPFTRKLIDNIEEGILLIQTDCTIVLFNHAADSIFNDIRGIHLAAGILINEVTETHLSQSVHVTIEQVIREKEPKKAFGYYLNKRGANVYLIYTLIPLLDSTGNLSYIQVIINDITEQNIFETKLVNQAKNISDFIENAHAIIIGVDTRGYVTEWNRHTFVTTGLKKNDIYARKLIDFLLPEAYKNTFEKALQRVLISNHIGTYEVPVITHDKAIRILLLSITQRLSATGEVIGATLMGQDITELSEYRKTLEQKVEARTRELKQSLDKEKEALEIKNRFISIASHEFRTPLDFIRFNAKAIKQSKLVKPSKRIISRIGEIEKQAERMSFLLDDVLTYSKSEPGKIKLIPSELPLAEVVQAICNEVYLSTKKTHFITKEFISIPSQINTDEKLFRNILINLLTNAIKFSPDSNEVHLTVQGSGNQLELQIKDSGIGISREDLVTIFEPFIRSKSADSIPGTGLGLSIVKRAVDLLKGSIQIESQLNLGTKISVTIPQTIHET